MAKKQRQTTKHFGHQPPLHEFFLNPYTDARFTRCPKCDQPTKLRKKPLLIFIKPAQPVILGKTCRYCPKCDLLIAHKDELDRLLEGLSQQYYPGLVGNDYLVVGTLDRNSWKKGVHDRPDLEELLKPLHDFKRHLEFEVTGYGWCKDD
jgi:hypothetical protein